MNRMMRICLLNQNSHLLHPSLFTLLFFAHLLPLIYCFLYLSFFPRLLSLSFPSFLANALTPFFSACFSFFYCLLFCVLWLILVFIYAAVSIISLFLLLSHTAVCHCSLSSPALLVCSLFMVLYYLSAPFFLFFPLSSFSSLLLITPSVICCFSLVKSPQQFTLMILLLFSSLVQFPLTQPTDTRDLSSEDW